MNIRLFIRLFFSLLVTLTYFGNSFLHADSAIYQPLPVSVAIEKKTDLSQDMMKKVSMMLDDKKVQEAFKNNLLVRFSSLEDEEDAEYVQNQNGDFYKAYICKYYPKVFAIRDLFEYMRPMDLEIALHDITVVLSQDPAFYFVDDKEKFKTPMYWEFIVDQCSFIDDFLRQAKVDLANDVIIASPRGNNGFDEGYSAMPSSRGMGNSLLTYLKKTPQAYVFDFYALCFDYLIKLFNEGILIKNMQQAQRYLYELEYVLERLKGSRYEAIYQEALKTSKQLMAKLKKILTKNELEEDNTHYDDKTRQMIEEGKKLGFYS